MTIGTMLQCDVCLNRIDKKGYFCEAFLNLRIPNVLVKQEVLHNKPFEGDNGIRFEQDPKMPKPPKLEF